MKIILVTGASRGIGKEIAKQLAQNGHKVIANYNKSVEQAKQYIAEEQFAKGSMLPKIEAAVRFAESGEGRHTLITLLEKAAAGIAGKTGTIIKL